MPDYQYVAWFRDHLMRSSDQDSKWCACFLVAASDGRAARTWGDRLALDYSSRQDGCEFLRSYLDPNPWQEGAAPRVVVGETVSDEIIGW